MVDGCRPRQKERSAEFRRRKHDTEQRDSWEWIWSCFLPNLINLRWVWSIQLFATARKCHRASILDSVCLFESPVHLHEIRNKQICCSNLLSCCCEPANLHAAPGQRSRRWDAAAFNIRHAVTAWAYDGYWYGMSWCQGSCHRFNFALTRLHVENLIFRIRCLMRRDMFNFSNTLFQYDQFFEYCFSMKTYVEFLIHYIIVYFNKRRPIFKKQKRYQIWTKTRFKISKKN